MNSKYERLPSFCLSKSLFFVEKCHFYSQASCSLLSLLSTLNEKTIDQCCINILLTEVYKYLNHYSSDLMNEVIFL